METETINKENALNAYKAGNDNVKAVLKKLLPKLLGNTNIMERVKTWEDVCDIKGIDPVRGLPYPKPANDEQEGVNAFFQVSTISEVLNEEWRPDWTNSNEAKFYPWFDSYKAGVGFSCSFFGDWRTSTICGSRLCYKSSELAVYAGTQFIDIYNKFLTLN